jgi:hypothetical protein
VARYCLSHAQCPVIAVPPAEITPSRLRGLRGWVLRHRDASLDEVLEHWGRTPA